MLFWCSKSFAIFFSIEGKNPTNILIVSLGLHKTEKATVFSSGVCLPKTIKIEQQMGCTADALEPGRLNGSKSLL